MRTGRPAAAALLVLAPVVAGCGGSSATSAPPASAPPASAAPTFAPSSELQASLPTSVGGVTLASASAGAMSLFRGTPGPTHGLTLLVSDLGISPAQVEVAAAADSAGKIQIVAATFGGVASAAIQAGLEKIAKQVDQSVTIALGTMGGKSIATYIFPESQLEPVVSYILEDTVYVITSSDQALIEDALGQLP